MRAGRVVVLPLAALAVACSAGPSGGDGGPVDGGPTPVVPPPELHAWAPSGAEGPPGAWMDLVVSASGDLGSEAWALSLEGLPAGLSARFEPPDVSATHGAVLRLDLPRAATASVVTPTLVATSGSRRIELGLPLTIGERTGVPADVQLQVRAPLSIGPTGAVAVLLAGSVVEMPVQVSSIAGFSGEVRLLAQDPAGTMSVTPTTVNVAPGAPAAATLTVRVTDEAPGAVVAVHRRSWRAATGLTGATVELRPTPGLHVPPLPRTWVRPGASAVGSVLLRAWGGAGAGATLTAGAADGVTASSGPFTNEVAPVTFTALAGALAGPRDLLLTASAGGAQARRTARVVVLGPTSALASPELLAPPLPSSAGGPATAFALDLLVDGAGLELGRSDSGWWRARESNGFAPEFLGTTAPTARIAGVLGGRVTATAQPNGSLGVVETRSDVGTRPWSLPAGGTASRAALAYDTSKQLWCVATAGSPDRLRAWKMDATWTATAVPVEVSAGLPQQVVSLGPWLTAGVGPPTVAFANDGAFRVMQLVGSTWGELPDPGVATGQLPLDVALAMDDAGRPVLAWLDDAAVHVKRLEGGAWVELGPVPRATASIPRELALVVDRWGAPLLAWSEAAYEPPPFARLEGLASRVWFTRFESGAWRTPVDVQLDPEADARSLEAALAPDGRLVLAWTEDRVVVLLRGVP